MPDIGRCYGQGPSPMDEGIGIPGTLVVNLAR
jgi:hypothetical protein